MSWKYCMVNFRVIRVKVVAPEKPLDVNIFLKITLMPIRLFTLSQNISVLIWPVAISKNTSCWFRTIGQNQIIVPDIKPTPFSLSFHLCSLPLSPNSQYLVLSFCTLCLIPLYVLPVMIPHKKRMMFRYDYHCLIDNKCLRMHLLFHLYLRYNNCSVKCLNS